MARAMTFRDAPEIREPTPEIAMAVRAYRAAGAAAFLALEGHGPRSPEYLAACDDRWIALQRLESEMPVGAWFRVGYHVWGWAKRSSYGGLAVTSEPVACPWPRRQETSTA